MNTDSLKLYCDLMEQIRSRAQGIWDLIHKEQNTSEFVGIDSAVLQFRKILELIALGSMVANKELYVQHNEEFHKHSNAKSIVRAIRGLNPDFFPMPAMHSPPESKGEPHNVTIGTQPGKEYLSEKDLEKIYEKCGGLMHADNPFGSQRDYKYYKEQIPVWIKKVENLLSLHVMHLVNDTNYYLINMSAPNEAAIGYVLSERPKNV